MRKKWKVPPVIQIIERDGKSYVGDTDHLAVEILQALAQGRSADQIHADFPTLPEGCLRAVLLWAKERQ